VTTAGFGLFLTGYFNKLSDVKIRNKSLKDHDMLLKIP